MITSNGWLDVLLYTLTRRNLIVDSEPSNDRSYNKFTSGRRGDTHLTTITILATNLINFRPDVRRVSTDYKSNQAQQTL